MLAVIGIYILITNQRILSSFEKGEKHFREITTAATEVSSYAKRAEGHLVLYLVLHRKSDKEKFPGRIASLNKYASIIDKKINNIKARKIFDKIKTNIHNALSVGNALIVHHDKEMEDLGKFEIEKYQDLVFELHEGLSAIRSYGVELAAFEIKLENEIKTTVLKNASRMRVYILLLMVVASGFTVYLGYMLFRMINTLNREIDARIQSEKTILLERNKLRDALSKVKILSGLVPICAVCKKIRDDKGFWNQIDIYLHEHSELQFSHGICPECTKKFYPELDDKHHTNGTS